MLQHGLCLAAPWIRGLGFYPPHALEDVREGALDHCYLGLDWGQRRTLTRSALDLAWAALRVGGVLACSAEESSFPRGRFGEWLFRQPHWQALDDVHNIPSAPGQWFACVRKTADGGHVHKPLSREKFDLLVIRSGGHGDGLLAGLVADRIKAENPGIHITYLVTEEAGEVLETHPHIDRLLQFQKHRFDRGDNFAALYQAWKARFAQTLYLNETFETTLLAGGDDPWFAWPKAARAKLSDHNYEEFLCLAAGVKFAPGAVRFYPTDEEMDAASGLCGELDIAWCMAGSTNHKILPFSGAAITRILAKFPTAHVHLLGGKKRDGELAKHIRKQVRDFSGDDKRLHDRTGFPLRVNYAFAQVCDLVIGPETGLMWAVAYEDVPKLVVLSHSTVENLTKHWRNADAIWPVECPLYPCHQLHFEGHECPVNDMGVAVCAAAIDLEITLQKAFKLLEMTRGMQIRQRIQFSDGARVQRLSAAE